MKCCPNVFLTFIMIKIWRTFPFGRINVPLTLKCRELIIYKKDCLTLTTGESLEHRWGGVGNNLTRVFKNNRK